MRTTTSRVLAASCVASLCVLAVGACSDSKDQQAPGAGSVELQQGFHAVDSTIDIRTVETPEGKVLHYIDQGNPEGQPVLLITGFGTSVTAALLTTHLAQLRDQLGIRVVSLQRNGFGEQPYREKWDYQDYVDEVSALLAILEIEDFHIFAISGGGPYSAFVAQALGERIESIHLAAAITGSNVVDGVSTLPNSLGVLCQIAAGDTPLTSVRQLLGSFALESAEMWWDFSPQNPMLEVAGFEQAAAIDWDYTFFAGDSEQALTALAAEAIRYCDNVLPDLAGITAPLYIYHGEADESAPLANIDAWQERLVNASTTTVRLYPDEGHWVQYSHLDQIFADISQPGSLLVCDASGQSLLVPEADGLSWIRDMGASVGMCQPQSP